MIDIDELVLSPVLLLSPRQSEPDVVDDQVQVQPELLSERDPKYYFDFAVFLIVCTWFPNNSTKATDFFTSIFERISSDETPIRVDNVQKLDFQALLKLIYPLNPTYEQPTLSQDEWISVLKLASLWMMLDIRDMAIQALSPQPASQKIILAKEYGVYDWLRAGYIDFATRQECISVEEVTTLGIDVALKLVSIREDVLQSRRLHGVGDGVIDYNARNSPVDTEFSTELEEVRIAGSMDPVDRVIMAREHKVEEWLRSAYIALTERRNVISVEEAKKLGLETTIKLCQIREALLRTYVMVDLWMISNTPERNVETTFMEELEGVRFVNSRYHRRPPTPEPGITPEPSIAIQPMTPTKGKKKKHRR